jgi:hypothetical protein
MASLALLLDEHYPASLAHNLLKRGIDAQAVIERDDLRGRDDITVLSVGTQEGRVVVTEDVTTFPIAMNAVPDFVGVIFCESRRFPRTVAALPRLEYALAALVANPPVSAHCLGFVWWLQPPDET